MGYNFGRKVQCPPGCQNEDRQQHVTTCNVIKNSCFDVMINNVDMNVIYSQDKEKIKSAVKVFESAFRTRQELLEEQN